MESIPQLQLSFPKRPQVSPKFKEKQIQLISNHFPITLSTLKQRIYQYDVKIIDSQTEEPIAADAREHRNKVLTAAQSTLIDRFGENRWISGLSLWSQKHQESIQTIPINMREGLSLSIIIKKVREFDLSPGAFRQEDISASLLQYVNIIIQRYFRKKNYQEWGRNCRFYDQSKTYEIPEVMLKIYCGFKTSCELYLEYKPKILIDFSCKIIRTETVLDFIKNAGLNSRAERSLQGRSVMPCYGNKRMWRVDAVDFSTNPYVKQVEIDGVKISVAEYYKKKYDITIQEKNQPLLVHVNRKTGQQTFFVPSLTVMTGLEDQMRQDPRIMAKVAEVTRLPPQERKERIENEAGQLSDFVEENYDMKMKLDTPLNGYVLKPPRLTFAEPFAPENGNYNIRDPILKPACFKTWLLVYPKKYQESAQVLLENLEACSGEHSIKVNKPVMIAIEGTSTKILKERIKENVKKDTQIVVCMYPRELKTDWYKALKEVCTNEIGVPSQAVILNTLKKHTIKVCSKISLQMNTKIGLEPWITERPEGLPERTMIIGVDVYHKTKVGEELKSCIGFCASLDPNFSKFFSKVSFQKRIGEEIMINLGQLVKEAALRYFQANKKKFLPECIILFRDGIAENQLKVALETETRGILEQLKTIDPNYEPKFAEIIVNTRVDDRIFTKEPRTLGGRNSSPTRRTINPPAGTLVAEGIVSNKFDYFIVSQSVTQGTCTPTRFTVIYDTTSLSQDMFWQLSYWQSYNYYNWSGSVRVPAPVKYAHRIAYLAGQTVQGEIHSNIAEKLHFL